MRDLASNIAARKSIAQAARTASVSGTGVDRSGFESVTILFHVGSWGAGSTVTCLVQHADVDSDAQYATVDAEFLVGTPPVVEDNGESPSAADAANAIHPIGYVGGKQFVRARAVYESTESPQQATYIGADIVLGHARERPTS